MKFSITLIITALAGSTVLALPVATEKREEVKRSPEPYRQDPVQLCLDGVEATFQQTWDQDGKTDQNIQEYQQAIQTCQGNPVSSKAKRSAEPYVQDTAQLCLNGVKANFQQTWDEEGKTAANIQEYQEAVRRCQGNSLSYKAKRYVEDKRQLCLKNVQASFQQLWNSGDGEAPTQQSLDNYQKALARCNSISQKKRSAEPYVANGKQVCLNTVQAAFQQSLSSGETPTQQALDNYQAQLAQCNNVV